MVDGRGVGAMAGEERDIVTDDAWDQRFTWKEWKSVSMYRLGREHVLGNVSPSWPGSMGVSHATVARRTNSQLIAGVVGKCVQGVMSLYGKRSCNASGGKRW